jgi:hypothetical protein
LRSGTRQRAKTPATVDRGLTTARGDDQVDGGGGLITMINSRLADDAFRQQVVEILATDTTFVGMVETLGLAQEMSDAVRRIVESLPAPVVAEIRAAVTESLNAGTRTMPVDCNLSQTEIDRGAPVSVAVVDESGSPTIRVRSSK